MNIYGLLWSFLRDTMTRGTHIAADTREKPYEEYSARLDVAALEQVDRLKKQFPQLFHETRERICWACHATYTGTLGRSGKCPTCERGRPDEPLDVAAAEHPHRPSLLRALKELSARCVEVKAALDAGIPDGDPVHPQSAALTWPLSTAGLAIKLHEESLQQEPTGTDAWILWFADIDREDVHFAGYGAEEAARRAFEVSKLSWTCRLFKCVAATGYGPTPQKAKGDST